MNKLKMMIPGSIHSDGAKEAFKKKKSCLCIQYNITFFLSSLLSKHTLETSLIDTENR